jgi:hypothetical protein
MHKDFWWDNLTESDCLEELGIDERTLLKLALKK